MAIFLRYKIQSKKFSFQSPCWMGEKKVILKERENKKKTMLRLVVYRQQCLQTVVMTKFSWIETTAAIKFRELPKTLKTKALVPGKTTAKQVNRQEEQEDVISSLSCWLLLEMKIL